MKQIFTISNQLIALGKRLAMVLTMLLVVGVGSVWGAEVTYVFKSKSWEATIGETEANWINNKDGAGFSNNGIQVTTTATGANATSPISYKNISQIVVTYNTNKSAGDGNLSIKIGDHESESNDWKYDKNSEDGRVANFTSTFTYSTPQTGEVTLTANTTTNSIYVVSIKIVAESINGDDDNTGDDSANGDGECTWQLVTNASTLKVGDEIVIAASNANYALSTTQNSNNRSATAITKSNNTITFSEAVQIITLAQGSTTGTLSFFVGSGYLYAASSSKNYMRTQTTLGTNGDWIIGINNGVATIQAQGDYTNNVIRYNPNNGTPIFACYASTSTAGSLPAIYKKICATETTVTLNPNGGSGTMDNVTTENGTLTLSECTFTRDGYTFAGWAISEEGEALYEDKDVIDNWDANNTTLYAQWTPIEYQITYEGLEEATNGDNPNTYTVESETITFEKPGERVGYTFKGWNPEIIEAGSTGNVTIIATWEKIVLSNNCKWVEVTDNTTLEDGDEVVITMTWGATTWALPNNGGTSTPEVVVVNNVDGDKMLSVSNDMIWTVDEGDGNYSFYPMGSNATWLYCTNNNDGVRVGTGENKYFTIVNGLASDSENYFLYHVATSRYVGVYHPNEGIPDWRCYKLTDKGAFPTNIKNQSLKFYKKTCLMSNEFWIDYELANVTCTNTPPIRRLLKTAKPSC